MPNLTAYLSPEGFESDLAPERKHLLHRLVKEVRVQSRDTAEVWYAFPQPVGAARVWQGSSVKVRDGKPKCRSG